jgi:CRISPR-associated protein Csm2
MPGSREQKKELRLPTAKPVAYFGENGVLEEKLMDADAADQAKVLQNLAPTQLRRFYEHVVSIKRRLDLGAKNAEEREREFKKLRPEFKLVKAKAVYAYGRNKDNKNKAHYEALAQFFITHTEGVKSAADFEAFCKHFEAVIAYHKYHSDTESK